MGCYLRDDWECCWYVVCCVFFVFIPPYPRFMFSTLFISCSLAPLSLQLRRDSLISFLAFVFTGLAVGQMGLWAIKKHKNYKKDFGKEYPRGRKVMFPFVL